MALRAAVPRPIVEPSTPYSNEHTNWAEAHFTDEKRLAVEFDGSRILGHEFRLTLLEIIGIR